MQSTSALSTAPVLFCFASALSLDMFRSAIVLAAVAVAILPAYAQPAERWPLSETSVSIDALFSTSDGEVTDLSPEGFVLGRYPITFSATAVHLAGRLRVSPRTAAVASVPVLMFRITSDASNAVLLGVDEAPSFGLGNPYLGILHDVTASFAVEAGVWLPLSTDDDYTASSVGAYTDPEHFEAYLGQTMSARPVVRGQSKSGPLRIRVHAAPILSYAVDGRPSPILDQYARPRSNLAAIMGADLNWTAGRLTLAGGAVGRYDPEGGALTFRDDVDDLRGSVHASVLVNGLPVRPGIQIRVPSLGPTPSDLTLGLSLDVPLR